MKLTTIRWWSACLLLLLATGVDRADGDAPIVTNKKRFRIPFRYDVASLQKMQARELQMFVSRNRGATWEKSQTAAPEAGKFDFVAAQDGEYWFAVKTIDGQGRPHPPDEAMTSGLKVLVDGTPPQLELSLTEINPGKVQLNWRAEDAQLDVGTLALEFQQPGQPDWQPVSILARANGSTSWTVGEPGEVQVRGSIYDRASNVVRQETRLVISASRAEPTLPYDEPARAPVQRRPPPVAAAPAAPMAQAPLPQTPMISPLPEPTTQFLATSNTMGRNPIDSRQASLSPDAAFAVPLPGRTLGVPVPAIAAPAMPVTNMPVPTLPAPAMPAPAHPRSTAGLPSRFVRQHQFQLGYQLSDVGPSGISTVELYITQDNGQHWWLYGQDPDQRSPIEVRVPVDGDYGFIVRARSGVGLANSAPNPGDAPEVHVVVDKTPPRIELNPIQQGQGPHAHQVLLQWQIAEEHPAAESVMLLSSAQRHGPWNVIAPWQADAGRFVWELPAAAGPQQVYIRVQARDAAGNMTVVESNQPVLIDLARPTARITEIQSFDGGPR